MLMILIKKHVLPKPHQDNSIQKQRAAYWMLESQRSIKCLLSSMSLEPNNQNCNQPASYTVSHMLSSERLKEKLTHPYLFLHKILNAVLSPQNLNITKEQMMLVQGLWQIEQEGVYLGREVSEQIRRTLEQLVLVHVDAQNTERIMCDLKITINRQTVVGEFGLNLSNLKYR